ncbi:MAG: ABC transporter permease [Acidimicrobiales bacterium]
MATETDPGRPAARGDGGAGGGDRDGDEGELRDRLRETAQFLDRHDQWWTVGVLAVVVAVFGALAPHFFSKAEWDATSEYAVEYLLLALGQTFVIATAGIDLSDGAVLGFSAMASAVLMAALLGAHTATGLVFVIGVAAGIATGAAVGMLNGVLITKLKLTPFIITLGTLGMATGGTYLLNGGNQVVNLPPQLTYLGDTMFLGGWLPAIVLITAVFAALSWLLLRRTRFGMRTYAIGSNELAARRAGINVDRHLIMVYMLSGALAGVAGLLVTARFTIATPVSGANDELDAIAAVVIGGASLFGGRGTILGTIVGTFVISILVTGLVLMNVQPFWQEVAVGAVLIAAVYLDQVRRRLRSI